MEILKVSGIVQMQRTLFSRHFLWKSAWESAEAKNTFFAMHFFIKILKVPGKVRSGCNEIKLVVFDLVSRTEAKTSLCPLLHFGEMTLFTIFVTFGKML